MASENGLVAGAGDGSVLTTLSALSHPTRLRVWLLLLDARPAGMASGALASAAGTPPTTMSAHLAVLARAGLVVAERHGTVIVYAAATAPAEALATFVADALGRRRP